MLGNVVHPYKEDYLLIVVSTVTDVQTYILILYNYEWILEYVAPGLLSTLFYMLQDGGCQKRSLRQD